MFDEYAAAQRAVDTLSDHGFPVGRVAIVGIGLRYVEQVARRMTTGRAALAGAARGTMIGLIFALLFGIFFTVEQGFLALVVYSVGLGGIIGAMVAAPILAVGAAVLRYARARRPRRPRARRTTRP